MLKEERYNHILHQIILHSKILSSSLQQPARKGKIVKLQAGALSKSFKPLKIRKIKADCCFIGVDAIDIRHTLKNNGCGFAQVIRVTLNIAKKRIDLPTPKKPNTFEPLKIYEDEADILVRALEPESDGPQPYKSKSIRIF